MPPKTSLSDVSFWAWVKFYGGPHDGMKVQRVPMGELRYEFITANLRHVYMFLGEHDLVAEFHYMGAWHRNPKEQHGCNSSPT
jgi:hypothetical protein